jgi:hypothetical protein
MVSGKFYPLLLALGLVFLIPCLTTGAVYQVPTDQPTIQAALDTALTGDTVLLAQGVYFENIDFRGKGILLTSAYYLSADSLDILNTIIDGSTPASADSASVVTFINGEDSSAVIQGITLTGGSGLLGNGGGIYIDHASPRIRSCIITLNTVSGDGGGVCILNGSPELQSCEIKLNNANRGGGIVFLISEPILAGATLSNCRVTGNIAADGGGILYGSTIHDGTIALNLSHCEVSSNTGSGLRGAHGLSQFGLTAVGCSFSNNTGNGLAMDHEVVLSRTLSVDNYSAIIVDSCVVANNTATGLRFNTEIPALVTNSTISGNHFGLIQAQDCSITITGCEVTDNDVGLKNYSYTSTFQIDSSVFAHNQQAIQDSWNGVRPSLRHTTFVSNGPSIGAVYCGYYGLTLDHCLLAFNLGDHLFEEDTNTVVATCTNIFGNEQGDWVGPITGLDALPGNLSLNPFFCDTALGLYTLDSVSPCTPGHSLNYCGELIGGRAVNCSSILDADADAVSDQIDNCLNQANSSQSDSDGDGLGDACDNCPGVYNPGQEKSDSASWGYACCCGQLTGGKTGNVNCDPEGGRNLADITLLIDHVYGDRLPLCCPTNGNVDGDPFGKINLADITRLIDHVYVSKSETDPCL